ncbi:hypothetical protein [Natronorubrum halalkaliphilum]|nr:hypothetical protein [Natronorubrum halalkaliphilum]
MIDSLFTFEKEKMPIPVIAATTGLIVIFALGIPYRVLVGF